MVWVPRQDPLVRAIHAIMFFLIFTTFTALFAVADNARTLGDVVIPAGIGLCFAVSLTLLLSDEPRRRKKR